MTIIHMTHWTFIALIIAYLLGSVSSSIIVSKIFKTPDPRIAGSGNPGATNILRIAGKKPALYTLLGDMLKGVIAILIAHWVLGQFGFNLGLVAVAVYLGHVFPVFHKFKGGKGVATGFGAMLAMSPLVGAIVIVIWGATAAIFRYSSLAALVAYLVAPFLMLFLSNPTYFFGFAIIAVLIFWRHQDNIQRLRAHAEPKFGAKIERQ